MPGKHGHRGLLSREETVGHFTASTPVETAGTIKSHLKNMICHHLHRMFRTYLPEQILTHRLPEYPPPLAFSAVVLPPVFHLDLSSPSHDHV